MRSTPPGAELHRDADEEALVAVLAFEERGAGQHLLLVLENGLGHLDGGGGGGVVGAAGLEEFDDFGAAVAGTIRRRSGCGPWGGVR